MRWPTLAWLVLAAAAALLASPAAAAKKNAKPAREVPAPTKPQLRFDKLPPVEPIRPDTGLTTIAPYPPPHDTSPDAAQRGRIMNVPKPGTTTLVPLPPAGPAPEPIFSVPPIYPPAARAKGIQGTVMVMARVLDDGSVAEAHAITQVPYLDKAAEDAVRQWRFKPASKPSRQPTIPGVTPAQVWLTIPVKFTLH